ncbi:MAG TPA: DNA replication protein DnaC [Clostridiales bacterium]|nr:DNA replication protein DnaC [Clostridiales bacterium]
MAYSAEVVKRARARLAQAKEDRESENRQHLAVAYARVPRIREIDIQLRRTMAQAAQAAFLQGSDGRELLEEAKRENLELQQERAILAMENFEEGYLDDSPICDKCGGSGYIGSAMCECLTELCRQEQKKEVSVLSGSREAFNQFRLDYYPDRIDPKYGASPRTIMERNLKICRTYALTFAPSAGNLLFVGGTGLGKTFLSACIARAVADRGCSVVYESAGHLFGKLEQAKFNPTEEARRETARFTDCDLLILDDLGTEMPGQFVTAAFYTLLNDRILTGKPMVVSTNLNIDEIARRYSPQIASRLQGSFQGLTFVGEDIRVLKNRGL